MLEKGNLADNQPEDVQPPALRAWDDCFQWKLLFGCLSVSWTAPILLLALVGAVADTAGWRIVDALIGRSPDSQISQQQAYLTSWPGSRDQQSVSPVVRGLAHRFPVIQTSPCNPVTAMPSRVLLPLHAWFQRGTDWRSLWYFGLGGMWSVLVWAWFGGAIVRIAIIQFARKSQLDVVDALQFARRRYGQQVLSMALPLIAILALALPTMLLGILMRLDVGVLLAGLLWMVVLASGFCMALVLIGYALGWPLLWGAGAAESADAFDAISRSYAYTYQRPFHYAAYLLLTFVLGLFGWIILWTFSEAVVSLGNWAACWGAGEFRMDRILQTVDGTAAAGQTLGLVGRSGAALMSWAMVLVRTVASAYAYSFFWTATAGIYLVLRYDCDSTEVDDVYLKEDPDRVFSLPE